MDRQLAHARMLSRTPLTFIAVPRMPSGMPLLDYLAVGAGGFIGAIARYGASGLVQRWAGEGFPAGTLAVNLVGCLLIGVMSSVAEGAEGLSETARLLLTVGLLGSFTTFSTFGNETFDLLRDGRMKTAAAYVTGSLVLGLIAVFLGRLGARSLL
jgi:CrcB protein